MSEYKILTGQIKYGELVSGDMFIMQHFYVKHDIIFIVGVLKHLHRVEITYLSTFSNCARQLIATESDVFLGTDNYEQVIKFVE